MNQNKKFGSIARKIHRGRWWMALRAFLFADVCMALLLAAAFCYHAETWGGGDFHPDARRALIRTDSGQLIYEYENPDEDAQQTDITQWEEPARKMTTALLTAEGVFLLIQLLWGRRATRKLLRPLQKVADTAQQLSRNADEKLHDLENALHSMGPGAHLDTGDPDLKELEDAVNALLDKMRASYEEQVRFASDASHELRTPIAVIQGYADMLSRWGKSDPQVLEESIEAIRSETGRMKKLVDQLLFLARGDAGRQKIHFKRLDLTELAAEARDEGEMIDPGHVWRLDIPKEPVTAVGDSDMLMQTLRILTDNARKFTPEGGAIRIRVGMKNQNPFFEVQDEGEGIAPENLPRIFDRFFRADAAREGKAGGTGLGLSIARWIVERHGGYFDVLSRPGLGTRIRVVLRTVPASEG